MKKKITSFTVFSNSVGINVSYTYAEIENGNVLNDNVRGTLVVENQELEDGINGIISNLQEIVDKA